MTDPFLHHPDGTHRSTAPTANVRMVERWEQAMTAHLEEHADPHGEPHPAPKTVPPIPQPKFLDMPGARAAVWGLVGWLLALVAVIGVFVWVWNLL